MPTVISTAAIRAKSINLAFVDETTSGTLSASPSGTDSATEQTFQPIDAPILEQDSENTDFSETGSQLITMERAFNTYDYAKAKLKFFSKPHATAGTSPIDNYILTKFFGAGAVASSTWVFDFLDQVNTFSLWMLLNSQTMVAGSGCIAKSLSINVEKNGNLIFDMELLANQLRYATQATVASVAINDITINTPSLGGNATNIFFVNQVVEVFNNATGASRGTTTVSSISGNVVSVAATPALTDADDVLRPKLSTATLNTSAPVTMRQGALYMAASGTTGATLFGAGNKVPILKADLSLDRDIKTPAKSELTGNDYPPATYTIGDVKITGNASVLARPNDFQRFKKFEDNQEYAIGIEVQDSTRIVWIEMPYCKVQVPKLSESDTSLQQSFAFAVVKGAATTDAGRFKLIYK